MAVRLRRTLGVRDLVLFYLAAIVTLRYVPLTAAVGPSAVTIWLLAFGLFFVPLGLAVAELSSRHPAEGGIYVWSREAFGDFHGFLTGWTYWTCNIVYIPSLLLYAASNAAVVFPQTAHLATNKTCLALFSLVGLGLAVGLNLRGLRVAQRLHNASGSLGTWLPALILIGLGIVAWLTFGSATSFAPSGLVPKVGGLNEVLFWASIAYAVTGLESASTMGEEVHEPRRTVPRALLVAGAMIALIYLAGTLALLVALPAAEISGLTGLTDAVGVMATKLGGPRLGAGLGAVAALGVCLGNLGGVSAWLAVSARLPFVVGLDRYLPTAFTRLHPRFGTPTVAILTMGGLSAVLVYLAELGGNRAEQAYAVLNSLSVLSFFIPYLYLFPALIVLGRRPTGEATVRVPGGSAGRWIVAGLGFFVSLGSVILSCIPGADVEDQAAFYWTVFGTTAVNLLVGLGVYAVGRRRRERVAVQVDSGEVER